MKDLHYIFRLSLFVIATGACLLPAVADAALCDDLSSDGGRAADVECLERWIELEQSWPPGSKAQALASVKALAKQAPGLSEVDFYVRVAGLMALADNGHTGLAGAPVYRNRPPGLSDAERIHISIRQGLLHQRRWNRAGHNPI